MRWGLARGVAAIAWISVPALALAQEADTPVIGTATLPRDLSPWGMYINADPVVKAVLIGLAFASLVTWTVWRQDHRNRGRQAAGAGGLKLLASVRSTSEGVERLAGARGEVRKFLDAAVTELKLSAGSIEKEGIKERIASRLERIEAAYGRRILRGTGVLATIGAPPCSSACSGPFSIMNSFIGIRVAHHQSRRGRAGHRRGAAATAFGLAAAIPAVDLQRLRALDRRLSRNTGRRRRGSVAVGQPRPRAPGGRAAVVGAQTGVVVSGGMSVEAGATP
jgi:biopolymer transport protein ExbB